MQAVERMLAQEIEGKAQLDFAPDGLRFAIEAPFGDRIGTQKLT